MDLYQLHANDGEIYEFGSVDAIEPFKQKYKLTGEIVKIINSNEHRETLILDLYQLHANDGEIYEFGSLEVIELFKQKYNITGTIVKTTEAVTLEE